MEGSELDKTRRIHQKQQYQKVFSKGRKVVGRYMILLFIKNQTPISRVGIITSKKVGKAHERNLAKRRIRSFVRENQQHMKEGYDIVIIARQGIKEADYTLVVQDFLKLLKKGQISYA